MKKRVTLPLLLVILAWSLLAFSGCATPLNHIGAFAQATADLSKQAASAYVQVNETSIERRIYDTAAEPGRLPDDSTFKKVVAGSNLDLRISLLNGIGEYAQGLGELARADLRKEVDHASQNLYGALGKLDQTCARATNTAPLLTPENLSQVATAIDAIGTVISEARRRDALRTVIREANPVVQKSISLFRGELPMLQGLVADNLQTVYAEKLKAYQKESPRLSVDQRVAMLHGIRSAYEQIAVSQALAGDLSRAAGKIATAHQVLYDDVTRNEFTSIGLVREIKEVAELAQSIKQFNTQLQER
jgi:hypothetical protein